MYTVYADVDTANPGNPVFSCDKRFTSTAPELVASPSEISTVLYYIVVAIANY